MNSYLAAMRMMAVFPEIDTLPGAEYEFSVFERNAEIYGGQCGADVCRHVIFAFGGVLEDRIAIGTYAREKPFQVAAHFRIGILLNQQRRGCVLQMESGDAGF